MTAYFVELFEALPESARVVLYNIPRHTGIPIAEETPARAREPVRPRAGRRQGLRRRLRVDAALDRRVPELAILNGSDATAAAAYEAGGPGRDHDARQHLPRGAGAHPRGRRRPPRPSSRRCASSSRRFPATQRSSSCSSSSAGCPGRASGRPLQELDPDRPPCSRPGTARRGAKHMSETLTAPPCPALANYIGGELGSQPRRAHVREAQPLPAGRGDRRVPGLRRSRRGSRGRGRRGRLSGLVGSAGGRARRRAAAGRRRGRGPRRGDRAGHDARDGQAAPRGADGSPRARRDLPLLRGEA